MDFTRFFTPNACVSTQDKLAIKIVWIVGSLLLWQFVSIPFLPKPTEILAAYGPISQNGTLIQLGVSIWLMIQAIFWSLVISLGFAYASVIPVIRPVAQFLSGGRRFGLVGLSLFFTLMAPNGHVLKVMLLTFGISGFYLRDMLSIVDDVRMAQYNHARTLGMKPFRVLYEVVILGTMPKALDSLINNAAMGWMMLTMVEGISRSEGGIGIALLNMGRQNNLPGIFAVLIILYCVGAAQDFILGFVKDKILCPYSNLGKA